MAGPNDGGPVEQPPPRSRATRPVMAPKADTLLAKRERGGNAPQELAEALKALSSGQRLALVGTKKNTSAIVNWLREARARVCACGRVCAHARARRVVRASARGRAAHTARRVRRRPPARWSLSPGRARRRIWRDGEPRRARSAVWRFRKGQLTPCSCAPTGVRQGRRHAHTPDPRAGAHGAGRRRRQHVRPGVGWPAKRPLTALPSLRVRSKTKALFLECHVPTALAEALRALASVLVVDAGEMSEQASFLVLSGQSPAHAARSAPRRARAPHTAP
jgi:hypothetical protein